MTKILLLDDHALFRAGLRLLLETLGKDAVVLEAGTIGEALALASRHPDLPLCLLDLNLRNEHGLDALARIKATAPDVAIVVISSTEESGAIQACIEAGAMSFIAKSAPPETLAVALRHVLAGEIYLPPPFDRPAEPDAPPVALSPRQRDVLRGLCRGLPTKSIARELGLSEHTVKDYIASVFQLLGVHNRTEAVIEAARLKLRLDSG
ncbi:response regulator [Methylococcus sp. EFPC2]|uniref:response regulator transcription factor n=1 Tax=Methylococcus sp. EFPC2 TaxID=2812648 RepID=UPI0019682626|nr:response regulator transcription factor [Methylococcus sp. EFPC2]QSA97141.1 response regulator transcription factor [Methylococcus sp. EFPC2]